ncbi:hypothetical protein GR197_20360 [Rhizobium phaseoli]|uniref:Uncharacterized protein n=1 Tax=Rhizobium phaseoli TaxID=396 RepID=A0A7K3UGR8_9HYPH|nr:hypothetical protein [Rhizobium phaseoli]NEJ72862.1 hypothetical protein [Rhizobium phaseoli]
MASPWKFLARLISPGREQKKENGSTSEATPDASATASLADAVAGEGVNGDDRPASDEINHHDQAVAVAAQVAPHIQRSRGKKAGAISHVSHADEISLDEDIRVLRGQLARKLKLQNAQLRKMLERFER